MLIPILAAILIAYAYMFNFQKKGCTFYSVNSLWKRNTLENYYVQSPVKSNGKCKKNPYIINQNHIFFKKLL
jgi:hypothetical protein